MKPKRSESAFYKMRLYHNALKRQLLEKYAAGAYALLDLSCGKGGDLHKWIALDIKNVVGYDIDQESILEARNRHSTCQFKGRPPRIDFHVLDLATNVIPSYPVKFDVATSMFALHYMLESEETFGTFLTSLKNNLKVGGYFLGCLFDGNCIDRLLSAHESGIYLGTAQNFRLTRQADRPNQQDELFGRKVEVFLSETVLDKPTTEYIVNFELLVFHLQQHGFALVETRMFAEFYGGANVELSVPETEVSFLNRTFVFQRVN